MLPYLYISVKSNVVFLRGNATQYMRCSCFSFILCRKCIGFIPVIQQ